MFPKKMIIVEDERITARYLKSIVSKMDIEVIGMFERGDKLLEFLVNESADMILMDINIKGKMDGLELTSIISKRYHIPTVFITAYCDSETLSRAMDLSPYGYIVKPFTEVDIQIAIKLAQQRYLERETTVEDIVLKKVQLSSSCWFDMEASTLRSGDKEVYLNAKQVQLLELLVQHKNHSVSQEIIESRLWPDSMPSSSAVRTLVYSIRKIAESIVIETHSKIGYTLRTLN